MFAYNWNYLINNYGKIILTKYGNSTLNGHSSDMGIKREILSVKLMGENSSL